MRNRILLFALAMLAVVGGNTLNAQTSGGPDAYGYMWRNSDDAQGPAFVWNSIVGNAAAHQITGLTDDNAVAFNNMGWSFHYYWTDYTQFKLGSNGWVAFNNVGNIASCFPLIPTQGGGADNYLAPFMSDLIYVSSSGPAITAQVWWWTNNVDSLVIEYSNVPWWQAGPPDYIGSNTFQLILSGQDSSITFMYKDTDVANWTNNGGCNADMEIGMENITGNIGLEVLNEALPNDSSAIKFYYPASVTFQVPDATPAWNANAENAGQFFVSGANAMPQSMIANVANVGNAAISNNIAVAGDIRLAGNPTAFWTGTTAIATGLAAGDDSTVTFPTPVTFTTAAHYSYKVTSTNSQDINPSNNQNTVELVATPCTGDTMNLTYSSAPMPDGGIAWSGGVNDEGAGVYIVPPGYPATINNVDVWIVNAQGDLAGTHDSYGISIYDDNGIPGTLLDSVAVGANTSSEMGWYRVRMNGTSTINSGGWYVSWFQSGSNVILGTETQAPISRRTFEILGGAWSPYRQETVNDFSLSANISITCPTGNAVNDQVNSALQLQAVPNPTSGITNMNYNLPAISDVKFTVTNMFGQTVFTKSDIGQQAGNHTLTLDGQKWASGLYYVNLSTTSGSMTAKVVVNH